MSTHVDLYDSAYARLEHDLYRQIRTDTYGQDLGQTSWVTTDESNRIPELLNLTTGSAVLEIGCGSGFYALHLAKRVGCRVTGLDINPHGIATATQLAAAAGLESTATFRQCDASQPLPLADAAFDAAFANDVLCHIPERPSLLKELFRVLRPEARLLFSDALIIGGLISHVELATRSSIGPYFFSPPGENERLLASSGFTLISVTDTSEQAAAIAQRWHDARARRRDQLTTLEGHPEDAARFDGLQRFLACVHTLTSERRLLRHLYLAEKPAKPSPIFHTGP
jgi:ubiquinone/menaquinone biosynthesis C-methylase UbiE